MAAVAAAEKTTNVDPRAIKAYLARFVVDWRSVTVDRQAEKASMIGSTPCCPTPPLPLRKLNELFRSHNPFAVATTASVDVSVTNVLQISGQTWQLEWFETTRDVRGEVLNRARMRGAFILGVTPPTREDLILINPLGIYIVDLNWSQQIT